MRPATLLHQQQQRNLLARNYNDTHLRQINRICFYVSPHYQTHRIHSLNLSYIITFFRQMFWRTRSLYPAEAETPGKVTLETTSTIEPRTDTLYILLYYHDLHNHLKQLPFIYLLVNIMDLFDSSFIHPANIALFTKAWRIVDTKYINLQFYIKEVRPKTFYLPVIFDFREDSLTVPKTNDILIVMNPSQRATVVSTLLMTRLAQEMPGIKCAIYDPMNEELFLESRMVVRILDGPNSYYDNLLFAKCINHDMICMSEKSATDTFHENYYFDKVLFDGPINPVDPGSVGKFAEKILIYLRDPAKQAAFKEMMRKEADFTRNQMQFKKIMGNLQLIH
jgi:hypothetical protein